jgi:hypothetical protein
MATTTPAQIKAAMKKLAAMKSVQQYIKLNKALQRVSSAAPAAAKKSVSSKDKKSEGSTVNINELFGILAGCIFAGVGQMASPALAKEARTNLQALKDYLKTSREKGVLGATKFLVTNEYGKDRGAMDYAKATLKKVGVPTREIDYLTGESGGKLKLEKILVILDKHGANNKVKSFWKKASKLSDQLDMEM